MYATIVPPPIQQEQLLSESGRIILAQAFSSCDSQQPQKQYHQDQQQQYGQYSQQQQYGQYSQQQQYIPSPQQYAGNPYQSQFIRYDELTAKLRFLGDASGARKTGEIGLDSAQNSLDDNERTLKKNRDAQAYQQKRIHRNAHPRFLHYFQFNREEKVKRLERELEQMKIEEKKLIEQGDKYRSEVATRRQELGQLQSAEADMVRSKDEQKRLFDQVVDSQPPTSTLTNLRAQIQQVQHEHRIDSDLERGVANTLQRVQGAQMMFRNAVRELREATNMNMGAGIVNVGQFARNNDGFQADNFAERAMQMRRDQLLNQARMTALNAADQLQAAFDSFPMEARIRFPEITSQICNAPLPNLRGANMFGTLAVGWAFGGMGDMMNDMYAGQKIRQNLQVLEQCERIASQQAGAVQQVLSYIQNTVRDLGNQINSLQTQITSERQNIFEVSKTYMNSVPSAPVW